MLLLKIFSVIVLLHSKLNQNTFTLMKTKKKTKYIFLEQFYFFVFLKAKVKLDSKNECITIQ